MITLPVSASMYQSMMANIQQIHTNSDGTVCITPMQVDANTNNNNNNNSNQNNANINSSSNSSCNSENNSEGNNSSIAANAAAPTQYQCYSIMAATPIVATTAQRLLSNSALNSTQNLVNNLNLSNSRNNHNNNSTSYSNNNNNNNISNIRCQIINASSLQQNSSQLNCHQQQQQQQQQQQNYLANVLQNSTAKVFIANPAHLNLANATNILNNNNTTNNNNNNNNNNSNNNGHIKIATAMPLPIVVATATHNPQTQSATIVLGENLTGGSVVSCGGGGVGGNSRKIGHKRRKQTFAKVIPIKLEEHLSSDSSISNNNKNNANNNSNNSNSDSTITSENVLNIQIVNTGDNNAIVASSGIGSTDIVGPLQHGNRIVSLDVSSTNSSASSSSCSQLPAKTIKLETLDN